MIALVGVAFSMTWTPGPNNMMLAASGANFGWRRTVPHALGVTIGFPVMLFLVAMGLGRVFAAYPGIAQGMTWAGFAAMLWFAWRIAMAGAASAEARSRPLNFVEAGAFQWINPKAWAFAIWVTATYISGADALANALLTMARREDNAALADYANDVKSALIQAVEDGVVTGDVKGKTTDPAKEQVVDMVGFLDAVEARLKTCAASHFLRAVVTKLLCSAIHN